MPDLKTSQEATGGALKNADIFRYSEESGGNFASKKHTMQTAKTFFQSGLVQVYNEEPGIDVGRTVLTLANNYVADSIRLFVQGVRMKKTVDYTETAADQITMLIAIPDPAEIVADYTKL